VNVRTSGLYLCSEHTVRWYTSLAIQIACGIANRFVLGKMEFCELKENFLLSSSSAILL
jgi:hypothetical protein